MLFEFDIGMQTRSSEGLAGRSARKLSSNRDLMGSAKITYCVS